MTYFEIVEDILNDLDSDPVDSIEDTVESQQVAQIVETTYNNIIAGRDWPHLYKLFQLTATSGSTPTHMTLGNTVTDVKYIKYNVRTSTDTRDKFTHINFVEPQEFMLRTDARDSSASNIDAVTDPSGLQILVHNDRAPTFWTSFDNNYIVFDSYDSAVDATNLTAAKTQCYGKIEPTVTRTDSFYFDLPTDAFMFFLNEAKSVASFTLKQAPNPKAEQHSSIQRRRMAQEADRIRNRQQYADFGRKGVK